MHHTRNGEPRQMTHVAQRRETITMDDDDVKKLIRRVKRAAQTLHDGPAILEFLQTTAMRALLVQGAEEEVPPVSKVSEALLAEFGNAIKPMPVKQFCGMAVKAVLAEEGWELEDTGVRIYDDPLFRSGATYRKADEGDDVDDGELLQAMVSGLSQRQLHRLRALVDENIT